MTAQFLPFRSTPVRALVVALAISFVGSQLSGCANVGDSFASVAFVDPAKYDLYDCERLKGERVNLVRQADERQALIDKAGTGAGGALIGEAVYRNDYIAFRAQKKLADEAWVRNGCDAVTPPEAPKPSPEAMPSTGPAKRR